MINNINASETRSWLILAGALLIAPLLITLAYNVHLVDLYFIPAGDLLCYFGTCFAIVGSIFIFYSENKNQQKDSLIQGRPRIAVEVEQGSRPIYKVKLTNVGSQTISDIFLFNKCVSSYLFPKDSVSSLVVFTKYDSRDVICLSEYKEALDEQGIPKQIMVYMYDDKNHQWMCEATRFSDSPIRYFCDVSLND